MNNNIGKTASQISRFMFLNNEYKDFEEKIKQLPEIIKDFNESSLKRIEETVRFLIFCSIIKKIKETGVKISKTDLVDALNIFIEEEAKQDYAFSFVIDVKNDFLYTTIDSFAINTINSIFKNIELNKHLKLDISKLYKDTLSQKELFIRENDVSFTNFYFSSLDDKNLVFFNLNSKIEFLNKPISSNIFNPFSILDELDNTVFIKKEDIDFMFNKKKNLTFSLIKKKIIEKKLNQKAFYLNECKEIEENYLSIDIFSNILTKYQLKRIIKKAKQDYEIEMLKKAKTDQEIEFVLKKFFCGFNLGFLTSIKTKEIDCLITKTIIHLRKSLYSERYNEIVNILFSKLKEPATLFYYDKGFIFSGEKIGIIKTKNANNFFKISKMSFIGDYHYFIKGLDFNEKDKIKLTIEKMDDNLKFDIVDKILKNEEEIDGNYFTSGYFQRINTFSDFLSADEKDLLELTYEDSGNDLYELLVKKDYLKTKMEILYLRDFLNFINELKSMGIANNFKTKEYLVKNFNYLTVKE